MTFFLQMTCDSPLYNILLVDDDPSELSVVERIIEVLTGAPICVDHVVKASAAVRLLNNHNYDLVLLDNRLSDHTTAEFTAPFINAAFSDAKVAIISNDINVSYLAKPEHLGVDYIVDKAKIISFLRDRINESIITDVYPTKRYARRQQG